MLFFHTFYHNTHELAKPLSFGYSKSLVITCGVFVWEKSGMFSNDLYEMWQNLNFQQKVNFRFDWTLSCDHSNYSSWCVQYFCGKRLNILVITFEKYLKMLLCYLVQQISYVSLSYFTANHSFLSIAGMHPVFPPKVTHVYTCQQQCRWCRRHQWCRWLQQGDWFSTAEGFQLY